MKRQNIIRIIKRMLPVSILEYTKKIESKINSKPVPIYNIGANPADKSQKRVLLSYVTDYLNLSSWNALKSTRSIECASMVYALNSLGYCVDIYNANYHGFISSNYDIILGQGMAFRKASSLNPQAKRVLYLTENPPSLAKQKEEERIAYLYQRHGIKVHSQRSGLYFKDEDFNNLYACIFMGEKGDEKQINVTRSFTIAPTALHNKAFDLSKRNIEKSKYHFLWMGSKGAVHKGLDILFDVFKMHPELTLHVCGFSEIERKKLSRLIPKNVIDHGFVNITSDEYKNIAETCAFNVFPSCSERMATSVLTNMSHGLIPLRSIETNIKAPCGEQFADFRVETIEATILKWLAKDNLSLLNEMKLTSEYASSHYQIEVYSKEIFEIFKAIFDER